MLNEDAHCINKQTQFAYVTQQEEGIPVFIVGKNTPTTFIVTLDLAATARAHITSVSWLDRKSVV